MSEEKALEIFEAIKRLTMQNENAQSEQKEEDERTILIQNAKQFDEIYIRFGLEVKDFQEIIHKLISSNPEFEQALIAKESEIMDDSI